VPRETLEAVRAERDAARARLEEARQRVLELEALLGLISSIVEKANVR
jgi:predicted  nucleic acid-binding Zn-ribbon protein